MRLALMIEGQEGVTWEQWRALARACEEAGIDGLFRSDHYSGFFGGDGGSLDAWATICALAAVTERITLGTLVSPATFRPPSVLARMAVTASHVSGGRIEVGLGAGWNEAEHEEHGFPFPPLPERLELYAEQLEIVTRSMRGERFDHDGRHYRLRGARPLPAAPAPVRVIAGGAARPGTVGPAVRFADEYNTAFVAPAEAAARRAVVDAACDADGRGRLAFSVMTGCVVGAERAEVDARLERLAALTGTHTPPGDDVSVHGTVEEAVERLRAYADAGVDRVMLQHLLHDDLEMVALIGREIAPRVAGF